MKNIFEEIQKITRQKNKSLAQLVCKLVEEVGELVQSCNKLIGVKKHKLSPEQIRAEILEECADSIGNIFSIMSSQVITLEELEIKIQEKTKKWKS